MIISGQRILITGAAGGIGRELVMALVDKHAELVLVDIDVHKLEQVKLAVHAGGGKAQIFLCDLTSSSSIKELVNQITESIGGIDVLINCAGVASFGEFDMQLNENMENLWRINVIAPMQLTRLLLPKMKKRGGGRIVNIGSIFGSIGFAYFTSYSASKFAIRGFSEALRRELKGTGVGVTYVAPRYTRTTLNEGTVSRMAEAVGMNADEPSVVARHVVRAIEADREDYYIGWPESLFVRINAWFPRLVDMALRKQNDKTREFAVQESLITRR